MTAPRATPAQPIILSATWSPAHVAGDETGTLFTIPAGCLVLGMYWRRDIPADAGATPTLTIGDALALIAGAPVNLASDDTSTFVATHAVVSAFSAQVSTSPGLGGASVYVPDPVTFAYVAGSTPGATTPEFTVAVVCVPIV